MFTHILLATDGSECALKAAAAAGELAGKFQARLTLINVFQPFAAIGPYGETVNAALDAKYITELQEYALVRAGRVADGMDVAYQCRQEIGQPATEIIRVAAELECDLIVIGSRGMSGVKAFLLGSVSDRVVHHAHCPVLVVK